MCEGLYHLLPLLRPYCYFFEPQDAEEVEGEGEVPDELRRTAESRVELSSRQAALCSSFLILEQIERNCAVAGRRRTIRIPTSAGGGGAIRPGSEAEGIAGAERSAAGCCRCGTGSRLPSSATSGLSCWSGF
jgi:hypothetical protein